MGRPPKKKGEARERLMQVRLLESEYDEFREAAESSGLDVSAWVRERLLRVARKESRESGARQDA